MMELRGWQIAFAGIENFIHFNTPVFLSEAERPR
jgi:hypothetical protein